MAVSGKVVAGDYLKANVSAGLTGDVVMWSGLKRLKINADTVAEWEVMSVEGRIRKGVGNSFRRAGNVIETAVDSALTGGFSPVFGGTRGRQWTVRIGWVDGRRSDIEMSKELMSHMELTLGNRKAAPASTTPPAEPPAPVAPPPPTPWSVAPPPAGPPVAPTSAAPAAPIAPPPVVEPDLLDQIAKLAVLRDQGVLSEDEFAIKKAELLARL